MTRYIAHRINTKAQLEKIDEKFGVEIDIRDYNNNLILQHDPFVNGEDFENWIKIFHHNTLILNIKSERIEFRVLELLKKYHIDNYFFLDSSFPMIFTLSSQGERNIAVRYSEFEPIEYTLALGKRSTWVWVDCFTKMPLSRSEYELLKKNGKKLCLVSPDLVGRPEDIESYREELDKKGIVFDAICVKYNNISRWCD
jgi:hypothetical protein